MTQDTTKTFDAARYLVQLKGRDYLEVKWRLVWLRTEHPDAAIETELTRLDEGYAVFKAKVSIPGAGSATGWGSEDASDFGDFLEKAETKALGRALAALGYGTQFTEDFTMVNTESEEQAVVDAPVERPRQIRPDAGSGRQATVVVQATPAQINAIYAIGRREYRWSDDEMDAYSRNAFGKLPPDLSKREASEFIDRLKATAPAP